MPNEREIALRALRAAGHDQAAELVEAIIPAGSAATAPAPATPATPAAAPEIPSTPVPSAAVDAATPAAGQLPEGILPLEEVQRQEREGSSSPGMSHAEEMRANEQFCASAEYHIKNGSI